MIFRQARWMYHRWRADSDHHHEADDQDDYHEEEDDYDIQDDDDIQLFMALLIMKIMAK